MQASNQQTSIISKPKLMVLTARFPYPLEKGDKLRVFHHIKVLSNKFDIVLISLTDEVVKAEDFEELDNYCSRIYTFYRSKFLIAKNMIVAIKNGLPLQIGYFFDKNIQQEIHAIAAKEKPKHIFCQLIRMAEFVRGLDIPKTIDYMDTFSIGTKRWSENANTLIRPILKREYRKLVAYENAVFDDFDFHTIISEQDRDYLQMQEKQQVKIVPNGVDTSFFKPILTAKKEYDIAFIGNMGYVPNVEGARYLVQEILPLLLRQFPAIKVLIAGARPTALVQSLASDNVTVTGWVEDIREAYASAKLFVAPLFLGSGQQNKILEAMAMKIPCVTSTLVNNAIGATPNEAIVLADDKVAFAKQITTLLQHPNHIDAISTAGLAYVQKHYSWESYVQILEEGFLSK